MFSYWRLHDNPCVCMSHRSPAKFHPHSPETQLLSLFVAEFGCWQVSVRRREKRDTICEEWDLGKLE